MPVFGPPIPDSATFPKSKSFTEFLLAKGNYFTIFGYPRISLILKVNFDFKPPWFPPALPH